MEVLSEMFAQVIKMSVTASWVILAAFAARLLLCRMPKIYSYGLWAIVGFRLICPFSVSSRWSIFNLNLFDFMRGSEEVVNPVGVAQAGKTAQEAGGQLMRAGAMANFAGGTKISDVSAVFRAAESHPVADAGIGAGNVFLWIWLAGMLAFVIYALTSWFKYRKRVAHAVLLRENIYECDNLASPFVAGIRAPKIYIPFRLNGREQACVLAHERCHIRRRDYIIKPLAFLLAVFHWFNPLVWAAYYCMCRDMEMSCDERAVTELGAEWKKEYTMSLLGFSVNRRPGFLPLAFGEPDAAKRIKNVLHFQKPGKAGALAAGIFLAVFITACASNGEDGTGMENGTGLLTGTESADSAIGIDNSAGMDRITGNTEDETMVEADSEVSAGLERFATAFCERDTETICAMLTDEGVTAFEESGILAIDGEDIVFGFSSPWPWDAARDYRIMAADGGSARILYYAWTSDPHVTVWESIVHYEIEDGEFLVTPETMDVMEWMCSSEEFYRAYPDGVIRGTRMDYYENGAGASLQKNAMLASSDAYKGLFNPGTAAVKLLNLLDNPNKVQVTEMPGEQSDTVRVRIDFLEVKDDYVEILMVCPWGNIWIPQDDAAALGERGIIALENEDLEALKVEDIQEKLAEIVAEKQRLEAELTSVTDQKTVLENKEKSEDEQYDTVELARTGEEMEARAKELEQEIEMLREYEKQLQEMLENKYDE